MSSSDRSWIATLARVGFAMKGALYLLLGGLALQFALGDGGKLTDPHGAVIALLQRPFGRALVAGLALGLALYAAWRFLEAFADANRKGTDRRALMSRVEYALSGIIYSIVAFDAGVLAFARPGRGEVDLPSTLTGGPLARGVAILIAAGLIGYGLLQLWQSFGARLSDQLNHGDVSRSAGHWPVRISRIGMAGRAIVLVMMGVVLFRRASTSVEAAARTDTGDSLRLIAALPTGDLLLAGVAAGLMAYGVFQSVQARYRQITPP